MGLFTQVPMSSQQVSLSEEFMDHLLAFLSGLITQICDIKDLKSRRVRHVMRAMQNPRLPPQVKLPTLAICLTDLLRPRNGASQSMRLWAHNFVTVGFHGIQHPPDLQRSVDPEPARHPLLNYVVEARLTVTDKSKFSQLKGRVDRDVVYSPRTGQFALRLRAEVGKHLLGILVPRLRALERLVDFVDAIRRGGQGITPQSMSLRTISFSYGDGGVQGASASPVPKSWQVRLDLTRDENIDIVLGKGSPHLRVVDCLSTFASARFDQLPQALLVTLPLYRALDRIESAWTDIVANQQGHVAIFVKTLEWLTLRYTMTSSHSPASERVLQLDIKPQSRKGSTLWHVRRLDPERAVTTSPNSAATATTANHGSEPPDDYLNKVLAQKVWNTSGTGWAGLGTGAAASLEQGIEPLLDLIDQTVRSLVGPPPSFMAAPPSSSAHQKHNPHGVVGSLPAPTAKPAQSAAAPPQQRPPPQQIISPNHGRAGSAKGTGPAVVVID